MRRFNAVGGDERGVFFGRERAAGRGAHLQLAQVICVEHQHENQALLVVLRHCAPSLKARRVMASSGSDPTVLRQSFFTGGCPNTSSRSAANSDSSVARRGEFLACVVW